MTGEGFKRTLWVELDAERVEIIEIFIPEGGTIEGGSIKLKHPLLPRARQFTFSRAGNWYSRYTGQADDPFAQGYIIKGDLIEMVRKYRYTKVG